VLVGQRKELAHGRGADGAQGLEQPLCHGPEQLIGLEVHRGLR
jgi:hypothetical protein